MKRLWRIPDFLDLEYFFLQDRDLAEKQGERVLRDRDRNFYLEHIGPDAEISASDHKWLIYRWLEQRRSSENAAQGGHALLPGRMWYELYGLFWSVFSFIAVFAGGGLAYSFLAYSGRQPVNVSAFFLFFVVFQLLFLAVLLAAFLYRKFSGLDLRSSLLLSLVSKGLNRLLFRVRKYGLDSMSGSRRAQFTGALAAVQMRGKGYGSLFFWPIFLLFQLFGIAFNFGVLGALLVKVASADLAFGWQSTIQLSSQVAASAVQWLALPWAWFLGDGSYPSLSQIEGSRMVLKDGFYHLTSGDLVSWWPFLCLAICCYCLLPRILLFLFGSNMRSRSLSAVSFSRADHKQLLHRLLTPRLETRVVTEEVLSPPEEASVAAVTETKAEPDKKPDTECIIPESEPDAVNGQVMVLVPEELYDVYDDEQFSRLSRQAFGYTVVGAIPVDDEYCDAEKVFNRLQETDISAAALLVLQEAWQPPIQEMLSFLRELRENCDEGQHIILALVGKPMPDTIFTPVSDLDLQIWKQKTAVLADPCLQVSPLLEEL